MLKELKYKGMVATEMPATKLGAIRKAIQPVIEKNTEVIGATFVNDFYGEIKKHRK